MKPLALVQIGAITEQGKCVLLDAGYSVVYCHDVRNVVMTDRTLRDEIIMAALQGLLAGGHEITASVAAAWRIADTVLEERNRVPGKP